MDWNIEATEVLTEYRIRHTLPKIQGIISHVPQNLRSLTPTLQQGCTVRNLNRYRGLVMVAPLEPQYVNSWTSRKKPPNIKWEHVAKNKEWSYLQEHWRLISAVFLPQKKKILSFLDREKKKTHIHPSLPTVYLGKKTNREATGIA